MDIVGNRLELIAQSQVQSQVGSYADIILAVKSYRVVMPGSIRNRARRQRVVCVRLTEEKAPQIRKAHCSAAVSLGQQVLLVMIHQRSHLHGVFTLRIKQIVAIGEDILLLFARRSCNGSQSGNTADRDASKLFPCNKRILRPNDPGGRGDGRRRAAEGNTRGVQQRR